MLNILDEEHCIQAQLFSVMHNNGWYPVEPAQQQKIAEAKMKYSQQP